ncbi:unnamed protein product [Effrenium voratum]|uniref:Porin n=1 Tax=Effrenium voratum TaxID=2562239 RepID=A0AA36IQG3_9DINO|nr:unnamed protein product [Effrenium voratum]
MMAVSTAQAADIIIPEPEVVEYVRVCDAAGTGFFYIPGTETCLRIHGYVRYDLGFGDAPQTGVTAADAERTWRTRARASFRVSTWADTELGPLRTYVETRWQYDTNGARNERVVNGNSPEWFLGPNGYRTAGEFEINFAWIDLAGLRIGKDESYFSTFTGYGAPTNYTFAYGPFDTNLISYTFNSGAFSAGISLEQGNDNLFTDNTFGGVYDAHIGWGIDDYVPHIVAGAGYDSGAFQIRGVLGYDTRNNVVSPQLGLLRQGGWSGKIRGDVSFDPFSAFVMLMYGENSSAYTTWRRGAVGAETFSVLGGASFAATEALDVNLAVQWQEGNGVGDLWTVVGNVDYDIVPGFQFRPEIVYQNGPGADTIGGFVRFERSF